MALHRTAIAVVLALTVASGAACTTVTPSIEPPLAAGTTAGPNASPALSRALAALSTDSYQVRVVASHGRDVASGSVVTSNSPTSSSVIEAMFGSIANLTLNLMLRSLSDPDVTRESIPYHQQIRDAIHDHDPAHARSAMRSHLMVASRLYGDDYERTIESVVRRQLTRVTPANAEIDKMLSVAAFDTGVRR